ncbi:Uncharacterised protein [Actinobacillus equuli]|nr:Uncharacterised protein [Actinobacillus equuli]
MGVHLCADKLILCNTGLLTTPQILQFLALILPLAAIQIYYAKQRDERNLLNDIAGYLTFGVIGMASFYLTTEQVNWDILIHPTLFLSGQPYM